MAGVKVQVELPSELVVALGIEPESLERQATEWILLSLVQEGRTSTGKAAEVLGVSKSTMIDRMASRGIPYLSADNQDPSSDLHVALRARR